MHSCFYYYAIADDDPSTRKTADFHKFKQCLKAIYKRKPHVAIDHSFANKSRYWRFLKYQRKQKYFRTIAKQFKDGIVAFGNWNWTPNSMIRCRRGPLKELKRYLMANHVTVIEMDEFRTSKKCCTCTEDLHETKYPPGPAKTKKWPSRTAQSDVAKPSVEEMRPTMEPTTLARATVM